MLLIYVEYLRLGVGKKQKAEMHLQLAYTSQRVFNSSSEPSQWAVQIL
jgi:hypothetical protein